MSLLRSTRHILLTRNVRATPWRRMAGIPFQNDLTPMDDDLFGLLDFKHYKPVDEGHSEVDTVFHDPESLSDVLPVGGDVLTSVDDNILTSVDDDFGLSAFSFYTPAAGVINEKGMHSEYPQMAALPDEGSALHISPQKESMSLPQLEATCKAEEPVAFISRMSDPYVNLALEDYIYNNMPLKPSLKTPGITNCNRLLFYTNTPCVVIGKNQNPYKEANLPLLRSLGIPFVRRKSGGGTVVHDQGNVNYSFMTTKEQFDRHQFGSVIVKEVNVAKGEGAPKFPVKLNARGDIVNAVSGEKISGSAYKLSKGRSYHHGTMLLESNLDVLRQLLRRDPAQLGVVKSASVDSVSSPVMNLGMDADLFIDQVIYGFQQEYGPAQVVEIVSEEQLPPKVLEEAQNLKSWEWKFGSSPKFTHTFTNTTHSFDITFEVSRGYLDAFHVTPHGGVTIKEMDMWFKYLKQVVGDDAKQLRYGGSEVAGYILEDTVSDWIGLSIDGTL
ncbi:hypothetical protein BABINDRAFT_163066 [Babjeviella inositovora NRRL Y-12698]|uniref:Putative lipoate-protein ligase A n=1 Tax=Babjeviella inositovora NRRL Y-12698 TaxID=984486 RepID=A0A1E3QK07_9ASCO|nr:uncharacterized protein BABINDRAFT_163066 [Babjeviella inositovora NRRL Y-12698]ODQ78025.1 hypothetical protein BABINDRAFT_163066 [Babjeviella inositovora NRRL Y-12698]